MHQGSKASGQAVDQDRCKREVRGMQRTKSQCNWDNERVERQFTSSSEEARFKITSRCAADGFDEPRVTFAVKKAVVVSRC